MSSADQINIVLFSEPLHNLLSKGERHTSVVFSPTLHVLVRVTPEEVAEESGVWNVGGPHDALDLFEGVEFRGKSSMHAENLFVNKGGNGQAVETVGEGLPDTDVVASLALVVESVDSVNGGALVVASQHEEVLGVLNLVCQQQAHGLKGLLASVHVVSEEQVIGVWWESSVLEQAEKIEELSVHVSANFNGSFKFK
jgi:hypothetical protein